MKKILLVTLIMVLAISLMAFTMNLALVLTLVAGLVGLPALWSVVIDLLKLAGVVTDGTAGKWNAGFGLVTLILVAVAVNFFPSLNVSTIDKGLLEIAQFAGLLLEYIAQIWVAKGVHALTSKAVPALSFSK